jgi:lipopolysaccharide/colanic/teichoic acid biosynthesis glycosyltransferase
LTDLDIFINPGYFFTTEKQIKWNYIRVFSSTLINVQREVNIIWKKQQFLLLFFDIVFAALSIILTYQIIPEGIIGFVDNVYLEMVVFALIVVGIFAYLDLYNYLVFLNRFRYIYRTTKGIAYIFIFYLLWMLASSSLNTQNEFSLFVLFGIFSFFIYFSRIILIPIFSLILPKKEIIIFAPEGNCEDIEKWIRYHMVSGLVIKKISDSKEEIDRYVKKGFPVIISTFTEDWQDLMDNLFYFKDKVPVFLFAPILRGIDDVDYWAYLDGVPLVFFRWSNRSKIYLASKKLIDILGSIILLIIFSPFIIIAAIGIKFTSKGPVFYVSDRVGKKGKIFEMFKFRSMVESSDDELHKKFVKECINGNKEYKFKLTNDSRVTSWGKLLRKTSVDEVPQFFNILKGELSLVGPRPPMVYEVKQYSKWHKHRLSVEQGLTGVWQVFGRARLSFAQSCFLDIYYAENRSLCLDLHVLSQSPHTIVFGKGAY